MIASKFLSAAMVASMLSVPAAPVRADGAAGVIAAGIVACLILCHPHQQQQQRGRRTSAPQISSAQLAENKEFQAALNTFGYDAGAVDGHPGSRTRQAVSRYQNSLGAPMDGNITDAQKALLLDAYRESGVNPGEIQQLAAASPQGMQGVPAAFRDRRAGIQPAPLVQPAALPAAPVDEPAVDPGLQTFTVEAVPEKSMTEFCNQITTLTATNGGYQTNGAITDPHLALNEMFCLDRTLAIAEGTKAAQTLSVSQDKITAVCQGNKAFLSSEVDALGTKTSTASLADAQSAIDGQHKSPAENTLTGKICLGEAYRKDDAKMALAATLTLSVVGHKPYVELVGHHLREGFGVVANPDAAMDWMNAAVAALKAGDAPVFMADQSADRLALMEGALHPTN